MYNRQYLFTLQGEFQVFLKKKITEIHQFISIMGEFDMKKNKIRSYLPGFVFKMILMFILLPFARCLEYSDDAADKRFLEDMQRMCIIQYQTVSDQEKGSVLWSCIFYFLPVENEEN